MIDKVNPEKCCLCRACADACPKKAVSFSKKEFLFSYPVIEETKCVGCNLCERACPVLKNEVGQSKRLAFAVKNNAEGIRFESSSGGAFSAFAEKILASGGYVAGAVFDEDFQVKHIVTNTRAGLDRMRGSRYVQSNTETVFRQVGQLLSEGYKVLFSGCPCQVAAMRSYLGKDDENLFLVDVICHGIPSQKLFDSYKKLLEEKYGSKIKSFKFRDKNFGWHCSSVRAIFENGKVYSQPITVDAYMKGFLSGATLKEACYHCSFKSFRSGSDITLGDYWGAEVAEKEFDDNKGISAVIVNTQKGFTMVEGIRDMVEITPTQYSNIEKYNRNLKESSKKNPDREAFFLFGEANGYEKAIRTFFFEKKSVKVRRIAKETLKKLRDKFIKNKNVVKYYE